MNKLLESQLVKFVLVGGFSALVDFGTTALFTFAFGLSDGWSKTLGFICGTLTAYWINRRWTFAAAASFRRFVVTMCTYAATFAVQWGLYNLVMVPWLTDSTNWSDFWIRFASFVVAQGVATVLNFVIQRFLIFRN